MDDLTNKGFLADVQVLLDHEIVFTFPPYSARSRINTTVTKIFLDPPRMASNVTLKKNTENLDSIDQYLMSFCEVEVWSKLFDTPNKKDTLSLYTVLVNCL